MASDDRGPPESGAEDETVWQVPHDHGRRADAGAARLVSGINVLLGLWLVVSPWVLGHSGETVAAWNQVAVGGLVLVLAVARAAAPRSAPQISWANLVLGAWLAVAPFVLVEGGATGSRAVYYNGVVVGLLVFLLAAFSAAVTHVDRSAAGEGT